MGVAHEVLLPLQVLSCPQTALHSFLSALCRRSRAARALARWTSHWTAPTQRCQVCFSACVSARSAPAVSINRMMSVQMTARALLCCAIATQPSVAPLLKPLHMLAPGAAEESGPKVPSKLAGKGKGKKGGRR